MNMVSLLAAAVLLDSAYKFGPGVTADYSVAVVFDGFIPIMGGNEGKAAVDMKVKVQGLDPEEQNQRAVSELTAFVISFNEVKLPLEIDDAKAYFPRTTVSLSQQGKVLKTDAPDTTVPVRLPGLDAKRFPDISYLPIELPANGLEADKQWKFTKNFSGSPMEYSCNVAKVDGDLVTVAVSVKQSYENMENEALEVVEKEADGFAKVSTNLTGSGTVVFDAVKGLAVKADIVNDVVSNVTEIKSSKKSVRKLKTELHVKLVEPGGSKAPQKPAPVAKRNPNLLDNVVKFGQDLWNQGSQLLAMAKFAWMAATHTMPVIGPALRNLFPFGGR